jgi:hypothetical protein
MRPTDGSSATETGRETAFSAPLRRGRRRFLIAAATLGAAAAGLGRTRLEDEDGRAEYEALAAATWRHSASTALPRPAAQWELVRYATLAASNLNAQPWRFQVQERRINVLPAFASHGVAGDLDGHELSLSLGCAVENLVQAAAAFGLEATPVFDPATGGIVIDLQPTRPARRPLFEAIPDRRSARTLYDGRAVASPQLRLLAAAGGNGVELMLITAPRQLEAFRAAVAAAVEALSRDPSYVDELRSAVRFSYREALATRDGLFLKAYGNWGVPDPLARLLFEMSLTPQALSSALLPVPVAQILSGRALGAAILGRTLDRQIRSSAGIAAFACERSDAEHWIEAGRRCQRFTLQATALGIRTAYLSKPASVPAVRSELAAQLGIGGRRLDAVIRFGYGPALPPSLRRPVGQVIMQA